jgi:thiamine biosynthesis protein ThiS
MDIWVNGSKKTISVQTVEQLLSVYGMESKLVVVEIDGQIIQREEWPTTELMENMKVELVHFVGGG